MTIHLKPELESDILRLARERGRDVDAIVDEAVRQYVDASSISDLTPEQIGEVQETLLPELSLEDWDEKGSGGRETR